MKRLLGHTMLFLVVSSLFIACESDQDRSNLTEKPVEEDITPNPEEQEIKALIEKLLMRAGNSDLEALDSMISDKANLGAAVIRDGISTNSVLTIGEFFERARSRDPKPYYEPVNEYQILVNKGQIAFVWADATLCAYGVPKTNNFDNFTLIKEDGEWKLINLAYTNTRLPDELKKFDLELFAKGYAKVWCSQRPGFVSSFFAQDGVLRINDGPAAKGTEAISSVVKGFMDALPDMFVSMNSIVTESDNTRFYWTMTGTNKGINGTSNKVEVSGFEEWTLNK